MDCLGARPAPAIGVAVLASAALVMLAFGAFGDSPTLLAVAALVLAAAPFLLARTLSWPLLLGALVLVIAFIPIRRYYFEAGLPFQLEPYRVLVAALLVGWLACLLVDERVRLRATGFEGPVLLIAGVAVASVLANTDRAAAVHPEPLKALSFLASFLLVFFLVATVTPRMTDVDTILKALVASMAVIGVLAVIETRTGNSPFGALNELMPLLHESGEGIARGSGTRAQGPAEHPIALSAVLVLAVPVAFYLASRATAKRLWWWSALGALALGALATLSRTGVLMLVVVVLVYLWLRTRETLRLWPLLVPFIVVVHFAAPGTLGSIKHAFLPEGGVIAEQQRDIGGDCDASGRVADIGPTLDQVYQQPLVGIGYGTRIVTGENKNACILDSQVLGTLLETGSLGLFAWIWFFARFARRLGRAAVERTPKGELCVALAASITAFAVSMFTFDALGFIQVSFVLFLLMGVAAATLMRLDPHAGATQGKVALSAAD